MTRQPGRVSSESVREATGRDWDEWFGLLDAAGAAAWDHRQIVGYLGREHPDVSGWWQQSLTVEYERARGKRVVGQTAGAGFQVGVQRSVDATPDQVWDLLVSRADLWLGEGAAVAFDEGERYDLPGAVGEIRVVKPGTRLRLTWRPDGWPAPATLQFTLQPSASGRTAVGVHLEKLPDADAREAMRARWRETLERLAAELSR